MVAAVEMPKISIAMCTFNGQRFLVEQLDSILNQSYKNIELIIVDDLSTDGTLALLDEYALRDKRVRVIRNSQNIGFVRNFDKAIRECSGEFIALSDQDDIWFPEKIESLYREIGDNWLIYSRIEVVDSTGAKLGWEFPQVKRLEGGCALALILRNCVTGHACLMRRELLELALPAMPEMPLHDQWLAIVAASRGRLKAGQQVLSYYRLHDQNAVFQASAGKSAKRRESKCHIKRNQVELQLDFIKKVVDAGVLAPAEADILQQFYLLYMNYGHVFYNWKLRVFLRKYGENFLKLFPDQNKSMRRFCRGKWYHVIF